MPLDLKKLISQLKNINSHNIQDLNTKRLEATYGLLQIAINNQDKLYEKLLETKHSKTANFYFAVPEKEAFNDLTDCNLDFSMPHITIATDGSQINPSAHEITNSFLINIGLTGIPYFKKDIPVTLTSDPTVYSSYEDIASKISNENFQDEDLIAYERTLKEVEDLLRLAKLYKKYDLPIVALLDGTLIHWHIEKFSSVFIEKFIKRFSEAILELKSLGIPVASFLSNSRSNDLINMLKIFNCPYEQVNCKKHCANLDSRNLPCNPVKDYAPVMDRRLIEKYFIEQNAKIGTRTVLFESNSKILNFYEDNLKVLFFYINTGTEIARVEIPSYVAKDKNMLELVHNVVCLQCKVGFGYPVTLSEAHLQAVVQKGDRQIFYDLMKEHLIHTAKGPIKLSNKELRKRVSFV